MSDEDKKHIAQYTVKNIEKHMPKRSHSTKKIIMMLNTRKNKMRMWNGVY